MRVTFLLKKKSNQKKTAQGICTNQCVKVLVKLFQKLAQVKDVKSLSRSAEREIPKQRFFLLAFSLRLLLAKKKRQTVSTPPTATYKPKTRRFLFKFIF